MSIKPVIHDCNHCVGTALTVNAICDRCYTKGVGFTQYIPEDVSFFGEPETWLFTFLKSDMVTIATITGVSA